MLWALVALVIVNLLGGILVVVDKSAARRGAQRTSERTLHLFALLGAWPLMAVAMQTVRHKTRKRRFLAPFVLASVTGTMAWAALFWWQIRASL